MALKFKPRVQQVRCVYVDTPQPCMDDDNGKVFAVIGPFENHMDKAKLQDALRILLRGWNIQSDSE